MDVLTVANVVLAGAAVVALVFGMLQVLVAVRDRRERLTIEVIRSVQTPEFTAHIMEFRDNPPPPSASEWQNLPADVRRSHVHFLQQMEMLGLLAYDGKIDLELVERTLGDFVARTWRRFQPILEEMRGSLDDPYLAEYFQWLAQRIDERMRTQPRVPAHKETA